MNQGDKMILQLTHHENELFNQSSYNSTWWPRCQGVFKELSSTVFLKRLVDSAGLSVSLQSFYGD